MSAFAKVAGMTGLEPVTVRLTAESSAIELHTNKYISPTRTRTSILRTKTVCSTIKLSEIMVEVKRVELLSEPSVHKQFLTRFK